jgi:predicted HicB family RNase H-like nuclease
MREKKKKIVSRQSYRSLTKQIRIDAGYHTLLKIKAAKSGMSIKTLIEGYIIDILEEETIKGEYL